MARRRFFRPEDRQQRGPRINERIRKSPIRLIDENGDMIGVVPTDEARERARNAELDLVEVSPEADPPVCRILDYGKYRYEQSKKEKAQKAKSKSLEMKEVRLGRSMKIDPHDIEIRLNKARQFLMEGHKVQIVQNFRGREMMHRDRGDERMKSITEKLSDIAKVEVPPRMAGRRMTMILAPDKPKIEAIKRREESIKTQKEVEARKKKEAEESASADNDNDNSAQAEVETSSREQEAVEANRD